MSTVSRPGEVENLRSEIAALEQLLEVHEQTTIEQSERLEEALKASAARAEELQRREEQQSFMAEAATVLAASLDYATTLESLAHLAVPRIADWCVIDVVDDNGSLRRVVTAHPDPEKEALARRLETRYPSDPDATTGAPNVVRTGQPELHREIPEELLRQSAVDGEHLHLLKQLQLRSYMVVPLIARGSTLGAITLVSAETGVHFGEEDLRVAMDLAGRAAMAIDNARLYRDIEVARQETVRILESITDAFFALDREWRFTYLNAEAEQLLQRSSEDLLGRTIWAEFPAAVGSRFENAYRTAVAEQQTVEFEEYFAPLQTWFEVRSYPSENGLSVYFRNVNERRAAEEALRASEYRFRFLADSIPVQVWTARPDGSLDYVSLRAEEYFGKSSDDIVGDGWQRVIREDVLADVAARWQHSLETGEPYEVEFPLLSADDSYRWHLARAVAQRDDKGEIVRWFGSNTDIHDQKEAEAERERLITALDIERERLSEIFQEAPAFIATLRGPAHVFETVNSPYLQLIGFRDVVGRPVAEALPEVVEQGFIELMDRVASTGEPFLGTEVSVLLQTEPGGRPREHFVNFVYQPMRDANGAVSGIFVHGVDVTDQVRIRHEVEGGGALPSGDRAGALQPGARPVRVRRIA
ncbi:hypothetical protein BH23GEM9_BH23GEM9_30100 [soil metagenome]